MNNEPFHPIGQEWRYFSREKSIIHTLHLAQLPVSLAGDTVAILPTAPAGKDGGGTSIPPMQVPLAPFIGANAKLVTNHSMVIDCYGATNHLGNITAQNKMSIIVSAIAGNRAVIEMDPSESGFFIVHAEAQSDLHTLGYQGPAGDGQITVSLYKGVDAGIPIGQSKYKMKMEGGGWSGSMYLDSIARTSTEVLVPLLGEALFAVGLNLGAAPNAHLSMWAMKVADLP